jgi:hypothetical protein
MNFYDLKNREHVDVPLANITKKTLTRPTKSGGESTRYQLIGKLKDGREVFKFVSKETFDSI